MNAMLSSAISAPIEKLVNALLAQDPAAAQQLSQYSGKALRFECSTPVPFVLYVLVEDERIALRSIYELEPTAGISASASALSKLLSSQNQTEALFSPEVALSGDTHFIQALQRIIGDLEIDFEAHFSHIFGDVASHQIGQLFGKTQRWGTRTKESVLANIEEYLHEESRILPNKVEFARFCARMDELKLKLDRSNAKVQRLRKRLEDRAETVQANDTARLQVN